jgi:hypothetical protein
MDYEKQLLEALVSMSEQQARQAAQLTALALSQSQTSSLLREMSAQHMGLQGQMGEILKELQKPSDGASLSETMQGLLQPLVQSLDTLVKSFNTLAETSNRLSTQLPPPNPALPTPPKSGSK